MKKNVAHSILTIGMATIISIGGLTMPVIAQQSTVQTISNTTTYPHSFSNRGLSFNVTSDVYAIANMNAIEQIVDGISDQTFNQAFISRNSPFWRIIGIDETWNQLMISTSDGGFTAYIPIRVDWRRDEVVSTPLPTPVPVQTPAPQTNVPEPPTVGSADEDIVVNNALDPDEEEEIGGTVNSSIIDGRLRDREIQLISRKIGRASCRERV